MIHRIPPYIPGTPIPNSYFQRSAEEWYEYLDRENAIPDLAPERIIIITRLGKVEAHATVPEAHEALTRCKAGGVENAWAFLGEEQIPRTLPAAVLMLTYARLDPEARRGADSVFPEPERMAAAIWSHLDDLIRSADHLPALNRRIRRPKPKKWDAGMDWDRAAYMRMAGIWTWKKRGVVPMENVERPEGISAAPAAPSRKEKEAKAVAPPAPRRRTVADPSVGSPRIYRTPSGLKARRGPSRRTDTWNLIEDGMTVAELFASGGHPADFRIIQNLGHVEVK